MNYSVANYSTARECDLAVAHKRNRKTYECKEFTHGQCVGGLNCPLSTLYTCHVCQTARLCRIHALRQNHPCKPQQALKSINAFIRKNCPCFTETSHTELSRYLPSDIIDHIIAPYCIEPEYIEPLPFQILGEDRHWLYSFAAKGDTGGPFLITIDFQPYKYFFSFEFENVTLLFAGPNVSLRWKWEKHTRSPPVDIQVHLPIMDHWTAKSPTYFKHMLRRLSPASLQLIGFSEISDHLLWLIGYCNIQRYRYMKMLTADSDEEWHSDDSK